MLKEKIGPENKNCKLGYLQDCERYFKVNYLESLNLFQRLKIKSMNKSFVKDK